MADRNIARPSSPDPAKRIHHDRIVSTFSPFGSTYPSPSPSPAPPFKPLIQTELPYPRNVPHSSGSPSVISYSGTGDGTVLGDYDTEQTDRLSSSGFFTRGDLDGSNIGASGPSSLVGGLGGRGSISGARLDLGNLNLVSWKRDVVVDGKGPEEIEGSQAGSNESTKPRPFNAISQILTHPSRPPDPLRGSRHPLPPVPPTQIQALPKVPEPSFYNAYLESLGMGGTIASASTGGANKPGRRAGGEAQDIGGMVGTGAEGVWEQWRRAVEDERRERMRVDGETGSMASGSGKERAVGPGSKKGKEKERDDVAPLPDLSGIPDVYFSTSFDLADPAVWDQVVGTGSSGSTRSDTRNGRGPNGKASAISRASMDSAHSHDLLSQHLDHLESHLVHEISLRTPSFFSALSNLQSLTSQTESCLTRIASLRTRLQTIDDRTSIKALRIIQRQQELRVKRQVSRALEEVESLMNVNRLTRELMRPETLDTVGALDGVEEIARWWLRFEEHPPGAPKKPAENGHTGGTRETIAAEAATGARDLHSVQEEDEEEVDAPVVRDITAGPLDGLSLATIPGLQEVPSNIRAVAQLIAKALVANLESALTSALERPSPRPSAKRMTSGMTSPQETERLDAFSSAVSALAIPLSRCHSRESILDTWRATVMRGVKEGMRMHLQAETEGEEDGPGAPAGAPKAGAPKAQPLADTLRDMSHDRFVALSDQMYTTMRMRLVRVVVFGPLLEAVMLKEDFIRLSVLSQLFISMEGNGISRNVTASDFQDILVAACELANARSAKVLVSRTPQHADLSLEQFAAIFEQAWDFINATEAMAGRVIVSLRGVISSQARAFLLKYHAKRLQASAKYVEEELWNQVDVAVSLQKQVELVVASAVSDPDGFRIDPRAPAPEKQVNGHSIRTTEPGKSLEIEGQTFFTVQATSKTVEMLEDYLRLVINFESIATDVMARLVEFLKSFNSRTCQVVLGAGAMRSAGLKNITAKHLALASQSLSIIICLLPYLREFVRRHLSTKQAVMLVEFDKLKRDYQEHQHEIHSKLVAIMSDRLAVHSASVRSIDWETKASPPRDYATLLVKECTTLHKVLSKYLSNSVVYMIMTQVVDAIRTKIGDEYTKVEFKSDEAKKRMLSDATFIVDKVTDFTDPNMPSPIEGLDDLVRDKPTPKRQVQMGNTLNGLLRRGAKGQPGAAEVIFDGVPESPGIPPPSGGESRNSEDRALDDFAMDPPPETSASQLDGAGQTAGTEGPESTSGSATAPAVNGSPPDAPGPTVDPVVVERIAKSVAPDIAEEVNAEAETIVKKAVAEHDKGAVPADVGIENLLSGTSELDQDVAQEGSLQPPNIGEDDTGNAR